MGMAIGVDSHKSLLAAAALDQTGRVVRVKEFPNDARGHKALLEQSKAQGYERDIVIEGGDSYGAGLARYRIDARFPGATFVGASGLEPATNGL